jgi:hypothetical protein
MKGIFKMWLCLPHEQLSSINPIIKAHNSDFFEPNNT